MRQKLHKLNDIFSWFLLIATSILLVFTIIKVSQTPKGEGAFLFGYRPVFVLTGSMEPYMMTNSICLTKQVDSIDDIRVGDVVTFHIESRSGNILNITHRIVEIENGIINTKGDNNRVKDEFMLTIDNIDAKVVCVFNQTAWLINKWQSTTGKVLIISFLMVILFAYLTVKSSLKGRQEEIEGAALDEENSSPLDRAAKAVIMDAENTSGLDHHQNG